MPRSGNTTSPIASTENGGTEPEVDPPIVPALTLVWSRKQPDRVGETTLFPRSGRYFIGRGGDEVDQAVFVRMRPGVIERTGSLVGDNLSRRHLSVDVAGDEVVVENIGRLLPMRVNGVEQKAATLAPGDVIEIDKHSSLFFSMRPAEISKIGYPLFPFGSADKFEIVGESGAMWTLRERIAFVALFEDHALILGQTGTGKELVASAIHKLSRRAGGPFVDCNAAALPDTLVEAEIFGNERNHPQAGMAERIGLLGAAQNGSLFLDEIGRLSKAAQPKLLRVLDPGGKYNRLGNAKTLTANVRVIGAMNKPPSTLEFDLGPRLQLRVAVPPLDERREDIPLIARRLVVQAAAANPEGAGRFVRRGGDREEVNIEPALVTRLLRHRYPGNVRDLVIILREAMATKRDDDTLRLTRAVDVAMAVESPPRESEDDDANEATEGALDQAHVRAALDRHRWHQLRAADSLGITRHRLARLIGKYGLRTP